MPATAALESLWVDLGGPGEISVIFKDVSSLESIGTNFCSAFSTKVAWEREKFERSKSTIKYLLDILAAFENGPGNPTILGERPDQGYTG